jgi:cholera toxin transcriptional activator
MLMNTFGQKFILADRYTFDPNSNSLIDEQNPSEIQRLGSNESRILQLLVQHPNEVIKRSELHDFVWRKQGFEVDDSSLTQAISTLRKNLDDSTKSPQFIKTVPKQGYQWIANVESTSSSKKSLAAVEKISVSEFDMVVEESLPNINEDMIQNENSLTDQMETSLADQMAETPINQTSNSSVRPYINRLINHSIAFKLLLAFALLAPIVTMFSSAIEETNFKPVAIYDDIQVSSPLLHPEITNWLPVIERCIHKYNQVHVNEPRPIQVIATGGQENKLVLNYLFSKENIERDTTLILLANQQELAEVCQ